MPDFTIRFVSKDFIIEDAALFFYALRPEKDATCFTLVAAENPDSPLTKMTHEEIASLFQEATVTEGQAKVISTSDYVGGTMFSVRTRRFSGDVQLYALSEFAHAVTDDERRTATMIIDMGAHLEVLLKGRDASGREAQQERIGLARSTREGGLDLMLDERGEANLLLPPGTYFTSGQQFKIEQGQTRQTVEILLPNRKRPDA